MQNYCTVFLTVPESFCCHRWSLQSAITYFAIHAFKEIWKSDIANVQVVASLSDRAMFELFTSKCGALAGCIKFSWVLPPIQLESKEAFGYEFTVQNILEHLSWHGSSPIWCDMGSGPRSFVLFWRWFGFSGTCILMMDQGFWLPRVPLLGKCTCSY